MDTAFYLCRGELLHLANFSNGRRVNPAYHRPMGTKQLPVAGLKRRK
jgi:hypothetical protein